MHLKIYFVLWSVILQSGKITARTKASPDQYLDKGRGVALPGVVCSQVEVLSDGG